MKTNNKLYKLTNRLGEYFIIAKHPTEAEEKLMEHLDGLDYGITEKRKVTNIELIASEASDLRFVTGHFLLT